MNRFNPTRWLRERPIDFVLALVILVVCLSVAIYQYRSQESAAPTAAQVNSPLVEAAGRAGSPG